MARYRLGGLPVTPFHDNGADWTPADDLAAAQEEAAKLRAFDAAYRDSEPHWQDDDATRAAKGFVAGFGLSACLWAVIGAAVWWAL